MGKRYFCEYCNKSFQDNRKTRRRHMNAVSHQRNKKTYFDSLLINMQGRRSDHGNALLLSNYSGEEILQIWLRDNPRVQRQYIDTIKQDHTKSEKLQDSKEPDTQNNECRNSKMQQAVVEPLRPVNLLEDLEKIDSNHLPPSINGHEFDGGICLFSEWG